MKPRDLLLLPLHAAALATGAKSFRGNPLLGSPSLNARGLHVARFRLAETMARRRRAGLRHLIDAEHVEAFERQGFVLAPNVLPAESFHALSREVEETEFDAREMRQGNAVTRFISLPPSVLARLPELHRFIFGRLFQGLLRYGASSSADPYVTLHTVLTKPLEGEPDPQTHFHSDTFHATAKGWLFLRDVAMEDGPFTYVPGSHYATPGRLEWEHAQSLKAARSADPHHALGSFRASPAEIRAMGYPEPVPFPVPANSLVVADTHGFHARGPSARPSVRLAVYGSSRTNPFTPFTGPDLLDLPGLRGRRAQILDGLRWLESRLTGRPESQPLVGRLRPGDPLGFARIRERPP
ncbi:MAG TPA: phytanoyl-CoA dioxygenase family protein [Paracoccaceae bacterium]|nr:phytanoyl-CoA dioxygenase family protein [Paracoccaceae bacterium]